MKILYHHRTASKDGMDVHIQELTHAFRALGHEVIMVGPESSEDSDFGSSGGIVSTIRSVLPQFASELLELVYDQLAYRRLEKAYRAHKPDILYERANLFLMSGKKLKEKYHLPFILEVNAPLAQERAEHSGLALGNLAQNCEASVWQAADWVLPVSTPLAEIIRDAGVNPSRIRIIQNGINQATFTQTVDGADIREKYGLEDKLVLGFTGFMRPWHGLDRVLSVLSDLKDQLDLHFLVVGEGPVREELEAQAKSLGVADRVTFTGLIGREDMPKYLAAFDVALQPSVVAYASPLKLFEYMGMGLPIIAPDQPNITEIVEHGISAYLFNPMQEEAFSDALKEVCLSADLRKQLGQGALAQIEERQFTWKDNAKRIEALLAG